MFKSRTNWCFGPSKLISIFVQEVVFAFGWDCGCDWPNARDWHWLSWYLFCVASWIYVACDVWVQNRTHTYIYCPHDRTFSQSKPCALRTNVALANERFVFNDVTRWDPYIEHQAFETSVWHSQHYLVKNIGRRNFLVHLLVHLNSWFHLVPCIGFVCDADIVCCLNSKQPPGLYGAAWSDTCSTLDLLSHFMLCLTHREPTWILLPMVSYQQRYLVPGMT